MYEIFHAKVAETERYFDEIEICKLPWIITCSSNFRFKTSSCLSGPLTKNSTFVTPSVKNRLFPPWWIRLFFAALHLFAYGFCSSVLGNEIKSTTLRISDLNRWDYIYLRLCLGRTRSFWWMLDYIKGNPLQNRTAWNNGELYSVLVTKGE